MSASSSTTLGPSRPAPRCARYLGTALLALTLVASCKDSAPRAPDGGPGLALRELPPVVRHPEVGWPMPAGYLVPAAHLSAGEVVTRSWFHIGLDGAVSRAPARWRLPTDAHLAASADARTLLWVEPSGELWRVGLSPALAQKPAVAHPDAGPPVVADVAVKAPSPRKRAAVGGSSAPRGEAVRVDEGVDDHVRPLVLPRGEVVYARPDGALLIAEARGRRVLWRGASGRLTDLATDQLGQRAVAVVAGEALAVVDIAAARGHLAYRSTAKDAKLFGPRFGPDGALYVRERRKDESRLLHIPPHGGDVASFSLPAGRLRAFEVRPDGTFWLGMARRGQGVMLGEVVLARRPTHAQQARPTQQPLSASGSPNPARHLAGPHSPARRAQSPVADGAPGPGAAKPPTVEGSTGAGTMTSRRLAVFARTLPRPHAACDGAILLVEEDGRTARLVRLDSATGETRILSPPNLRLLSTQRVVALCASSAATE